MRIRRSKIVCTLGPATDDPARLEDLIVAGMDVARINFSHGTHDEHGRRIALLRELAARHDRHVAVLQDLCGPKIRCGRFAGGGLELHADAQIWLRECKAGEPAEEALDVVPIEYEGLAEDLQVGDVLLLDDGRAVLTVTHLDAARVRANVTQASRLRDRVGVTLPARRIRLSALTEKDKVDLAFGLAQGVDFVAMSFVRHPEDVRVLRDLCESYGKPTPIVAKIETPSALDHLEEIIRIADGVMVARGDLGVELSPERVPIIQREILGLARKHQRPVIVATEMLQSMVTATRPTRAEASDVATAVFEGADAVMLSAETATGAHPSLVVRMMARIILEAEKSAYYHPLTSAQAGATSNMSESIARNAADIALEIGARVLVAFTASGDTARYASKARPMVPIMAFSPNPATRRRLSLIWGVVPCSMDVVRDADEMVTRANAYLLAHGFVSPGDTFVVIYGAPVGIPGSTNALRVKVVE